MAKLKDDEGNEVEVFEDAPDFPRTQSVGGGFQDDEGETNDA